jgi:hypothetical protein
MHNTANNLTRKFKSVIICLLVAALPFSQVHAGLVGTDSIVHQQQTGQLRAEIPEVLARQDVAAYLDAQGVSDADVQNRLANMTNDEVRAFHDQLESLPAGEGALGTIIAVIVIFMLLDMAGVTDMFPKI